MQYCSCTPSWTRHSCAACCAVSQVLWATLKSALMTVLKHSMLDIGWKDLHVHAFIIGSAGWNGTIISQSLHTTLTHCGLSALETRHRLLSRTAADSLVRIARIVQLRGLHKPPQVSSPLPAVGRPDPHHWAQTPTRPRSRGPHLILNLRLHQPLPVCHKTTQHHHPSPQNLIALLTHCAPLLIAMTPARALTTQLRCAEAPASAHHRYYCRINWIFHHL